MRCFNIFRQNSPYLSTRSYAQNVNKKKDPSVRECDVEKIRNIGIFAHIDAGKTTTTERMLYFSGKISHMGEVHHGNTITDFMEEERNRGITIKSAVVSFPWNKHIINVADTPGHIDFTMEVEQCLSIIDSSVIILDATTGVEAQTITVWKQANKRKLPRLIFANKFDRPNASLFQCLKTLKEKLSASPLQIHLPLKSDGGFNGVIDLINFKEILWKKGGDNYSVTPLNESHTCFKQALEKRIELVDTVSSWDNILADTIMSRESLENITSEELSLAVRRVTLSEKGVPLLCGSAYKNIGVQTLMNAINDFLPSPAESGTYEIYKHFRDHLVARSFKIIHDKQKRLITFLRIHSGQLSKGQKIYNINKGKTEQINKVMIPFGDDFEEVLNAQNGLMVAVTGLKETVPGDLICNNFSALKEARKNIISSLKLSETVVDSLLQVNFKIPEPVFFCSVEPPSQAFQSSLDKALLEISTEDPSLNVSYNTDTGQTVLAGMGELHLEIVKERLKREYKIDAYFGKFQIIYKEQILAETEEKLLYKQNIGAQGQSVHIHLSLHHGEKPSQLVLDNRSENAANLSRLLPQHLTAIKLGVSSALSHGPTLSSMIIGSHVVLHWVEISKGTSDTVITAAASQCLNKALQTSGTRLLEPVMLINITVNEDYMNVLLPDLSKRRSQIMSLDHLGGMTELKCETPLVELLGFAKDLRTMTSGTSTFSMTFLCYRQMSQKDESQVIQENM